MQAITPAAVGPEESPLPPACSGRQNTCGVRPPDDDHVLGRCPDVRAGRVAAREGMYDLADVVQQFGSPRAGELGAAGWVESDHRLTAAVVQAGQGGLLGHRRRQPDGISDTVVPGRVGQDPAAAQCRSQDGGIDGDDDRLPGPGAALHVQRLRRVHRTPATRVQSGAPGRESRAP